MIKRLMIGFVFFYSACASQSVSEKSESLDLQAKATPSTEPGRIPGIEDVFEWRRYFKDDANSIEKASLAKQISKSSPQSIEAMLKRGQNLITIHRLSEAELEFRSVLARDRSNIDALLALAQIYLQQRDLEKTYQVLESVKSRLELDNKIPKKDRVRYRYLLALTLIVQGKKESGHRIMADIIAEQQDFLPAYHAVAQSYVESSQLELAQFVLNQLLDRAEGNAQTYNLLGIIASRQMHINKAQELFGKSLSLDPDFQSARVNLANLFISRGEYSLAEENIRKLLRDNNQNGAALVSLGVIQRETSRYKEAKASFEQALALEPENASARLNLAILIKDAFGDNLAAMRLFSEVTQIPGIPNDFSDLAKFYLSEIRGENRLQSR